MQAARPDQPLHGGPYPNTPCQPAGCRCSRRWLRPHHTEGSRTPSSVAGQSRGRKTTGHDFPGAPPGARVLIVRGRRPSPRVRRRPRSDLQSPLKLHLGAEPCPENEIGGRERVPCRRHSRVRSPTRSASCSSRCSWSTRGERRCPGRSPGPGTRARTRRSRCTHRDGCSTCPRPRRCSPRGRPRRSSRLWSQCKVRR